MSSTAPENMKITYTSSTADMGLFHRLFDEALEEGLPDNQRRVPPGSRRTQPEKDW